MCSDIWHRYLVYKNVCSFQSCMLAALIKYKLIAISGKWFKTIKQFYYIIYSSKQFKIPQNKFLTIKDTQLQCQPCTGFCSKNSRVFKVKLLLPKFPIAQTKFSVEMKLTTTLWENTNAFHIGYYSYIFVSHGRYKN